MRPASSFSSEIEANEIHGIESQVRGFSVTFGHQYMFDSRNLSSYSRRTSLWGEGGNVHFKVMGALTLTRRFGPSHISSTRHNLSVVPGSLRNG